MASPAGSVAPEHAVDAYGFELAVDAEQFAQRQRCMAKDRKREEKYWAGVVDAQSLPKSTKLLKKMCRKGVPLHARPWAWLEISGAARLRARLGAGYFDAKRLELEGAGGTGDPSVKQIDLDLARTFPTHPRFRAPEGRAALRQVLLAYAAHNRAVGYCQSMNYVAGALLLVVRDAETAFWVLVALIDEKLQPDTYDSSIRGCLVEVETLDQLLRAKLPRLARHLRRTNTQLIATVPQWFLSLFFQDLPMETAVRLFDALLNEGSKVLHRAALAAFKMHEQQLLQQPDVMEIATTLRRATQQMHDRDLFMKVACKRIGSLSRKTLNSLRSKSLAKVAAQNGRKLR